MMELPEFISSQVKDKNTSLGDNTIFGANTVELTSMLLQNRYKQVITKIEELFGHVPTIDEAKTRLSRVITKTKEIEKPLKNQLECLCESVVNHILSIPQETILINCELVDKIEPHNTLRILPEYNAEEEFHNIFSPETINEMLLKRRVVNSLTQGVSYLLMQATYDVDVLHEWSDKLPMLYEEIIALNDFLLFSEKEDISDENPMLGSYVSTSLGKSDEKAVIDAQGLVYPLLLQETYRGIFEIFGTHGLPDNVAEAKYIVQKADFLLAEAWDLRIGVPLWEEIDKCMDDGVDSSAYPYVFSTIVSLNDNEFTQLFQEVFNEKEEARVWFDDLISEIEHDKEYQLFKSDIEKFNLEKCVISDGEPDTDNIIQEKK